MLLPVIILLALAPADAKGDSPEVKKLLAKQVAVLKDVLKVRKAAYMAGGGTFASVQEAELELANAPAKKREVLLRILKVAVEHDELMVTRHEKGLATTAELLKARAFRIRAEINLRRAGGKLPKDIKSASELK